MRYVMGACFRPSMATMGVGMHLIWSDWPSLLFLRTCYSNLWFQYCQWAHLMKWMCLCVKIGFWNPSRKNFFPLPAFDSLFFCKVAHSNHGPKVNDVINIPCLLRPAVHLKNQPMQPQWKNLQPIKTQEIFRWTPGPSCICLTLYIILPARPNAK